MIVITGASDGLGLEIAKLYKVEGKTVINISRRPSEAADKNLLYDLRDGQAIRSAVDEVLAIREPLEALINCAGVYSQEPLESITKEMLEQTMEVNVQAPILLTSGLMERIKKDEADIVNVASTVGTKAYKDQAVYGASKWALRGFSANLQVELAHTPCRVISFCPGGFVSKLFEKATGMDNTADDSLWMKASDVARFLKQTLDLPKNMEISEVLLNRKVPR